MTKIQFETQILKIGTWNILRLPESTSAQLPSRGMTMVKGKINKTPFKTVLEPDGRYGPGKSPSHWFRPDTKLLKEAQVKAGDTVKVSLEPTDEWVEPELPADMKNALESSPKASNIFYDITPLGRWDWVRWVRAVKAEDTRKKHINIMLDKLDKGERRPCCFNRSLCSEPYVSKNWVLLDPTDH